MRVRSAVRRMCRDCYVVKKKRVVYIRCKTVKKHKQRQGFHTEACVSEWQGNGHGSHAHGFGSCACCDKPDELSVGSAWRASTEGAPGILGSLPWLPAWASVPGAAGRTGISLASLNLHNGLVSKPARPLAEEGSGSSPLRMLCDWMRSSGLGRVWWSRH